MFRKTCFICQEADIVVVSQKADPGNVFQGSKFESCVCVCVCVCVCCQVRELVIDAGRDIMRNLELCVHRCFVYMWVEENALSCVL